MRFKGVISYFSWALLFSAMPAHAWDHHETLMPWVLASLPPGIRAELNRPLKAPCLADDLKMYERLQKSLDLNPSLSFEQMHLKSTAENCKRPVTAADILSRGFVDDPDQGMDRDLPDSADLAGDRKWMGGKTGPTSQGFRHMYFGGWSLRRPIETFQIPMRASGQAPQRAQVMENMARELFKSGDTAWAWRVVCWELHFLQDLGQPFHAVQVPSWRMLPWSKDFIHETTRIIGNYHWAYEGITLEELRLGEGSPLSACLHDVHKQATVRLPFSGSARDEALAIARASVALGSDIGEAVMSAFGESLKAPGVDLPRHQQVPDYKSMIANPTAGNLELNRQSCHALSNAVLVSQRIIDQSVGFQKE